MTHDDAHLPLDDYRSAPVWADLFAKPEQALDLDLGADRLRFAAGDRVRSLVSRPAIEHWLAYGNLRYPQVSLSYAGQAAPPTTYTRARLVGEHQLSGCADLARISTQLDSGATLVLVNAEHWHEPIARFCERLGSVTAADVQTFAYLTAPDQFGSQPHRDTAHVFVVQVEGSKHWTLYDVPEDDNWNRSLIDGSPPVSEQLVLEAGDGLYLPPGLGHRAQAGPEGSLHLTISVQPPAVREVVAAWAKLVARQVPAQSRLPLGPAGRAAAVRDALGRLGLVVTEAAAAEVADLAAVPGR
jgi:hypothetical protein